jgi:magnesium chelatase subunit D
VRAKRSLAGLPGGGGTPLAAGIQAAAALAQAERRKGMTPLVVLLTDGRGNVALDGRGGRSRALAEAEAAALALRRDGIASLLVDMSPRPHPRAQALAASLGGRYMPLPLADAATLSQAVRAASVA